MKNVGYIDKTLIALAIVACGQLHALEPLDDEAMSNNIGGSTAWILEAFKIETPATGGLVIDYTGGLSAAGVPGTTQLGTTPAFMKTSNLNFGAAVTTLTGYAGVTEATPTYNPVATWGTAADPFLLKAYTPTSGVGLQSLGYNGASTPNATLLLRLPVNAGSGGSNLKLGMETTLSANLAGTTQAGITPLALKLRANDFNLNGSQFSVFKTEIPGTAENEIANNGTLGMTAIIRLNSAAPSSATSRTTGGVLRLSVGEGNEGVYIQDLDVNLPLGQLHYQPLTIRKGTGNNLVLELMRIPNIPSVYRRFYGSGNNDVIQGTITPTQSNTTFAAPVAGTEKYNALCTSTFCGTAALPATHGSISIGNITFRGPPVTPPELPTSIDLGSVNISGLLINHAKLTTTGL